MPVAYLDLPSGLGAITKRKLVKEIADSIHQAYMITDSNGTISLTLSQAGTAGGITVTTDPINCATDSIGQVVGIGNPLVLPVLSTNLSSGTLPGGTYYVAFSYYNATGETAISASSSVVLRGSGSLIVAAPLTQPVQAQGYKVYIGTDPAQNLSVANAVRV